MPPANAARPCSASGRVPLTVPAGLKVRLPEVSEAFDAPVAGHIRVHAISQAKNVGWVRAASPNVEEVERLILANVGIGMLPVPLAGPLVARGHLWQLPPYDELPTTKTWLIWNPAATLNPAEAAFPRACLEVPAAQHFRGVAS